MSSASRSALLASASLPARVRRYLCVLRLRSPPPFPRTSALPPGGAGAPAGRVRSAPRRAVAPRWPARRAPAERSPPQQSRPLRRRTGQTACPDRRSGRPSSSAWPFASDGRRADVELEQPAQLVARLGQQGRAQPETGADTSQHAGDQSAWAAAVEQHDGLCVARQHGTHGKERAAQRGRLPATVVARRRAEDPLERQARPPGDGRGSSTWRDTRTRRSRRSSAAAAG